MILTSKRSRSVIVIIIGFATVIILLAALYSLRISKVSEDATRQKILRTEYLKKELIFKMRDAAHIRAILLLQQLMISKSHPGTNLINRLDAQAQRFIGARDRLLKMQLDSQQLDAWQRAKPLTIAGRKAQDQAARMIAAGNTVAAEKLLREKVIPIQVQVMLELTNMLDFSSQRVTELLKQEKLITERKFLQATIFVSLTMLISIIVAYLVVRNISRGEAELVQAREEAQTANKHKSTFLANMSHELRTPLTAILGYSEMLIEDAKDRKLDGMASDLQKINDSGIILLKLINDILDLSKVEAGKIELDIQEIDVAALLNDIVTTITPAIDKSGNKLLLEYGNRLGSMHTDPVKLRQVLLNLLGNAAKFTSNGEIILAINRETTNGVECLIFRVSDSGIGMTEEQQSKLFQPFYQADASTTRKYGGTGLGLAISQRFCKLLGGNLTVTSKLKAGSTFTAEIPAEIPRKILKA